MSTLSRTRKTREVDYPTSDGKPMAETERLRLENEELRRLLRN